MKKKKKYFDLFQFPELIPQEVGDVFDKYYETYGDSMSYQDMADMQKEIEKLGYTFDSGLDNEPYGLRPVGVSIDDLIYEKYINGGDIGSGVIYAQNSDGDIEPIRLDIKWNINSKDTKNIEEQKKEHISIIKKLYKLFEFDKVEGEIDIADKSFYQKYSLNFFNNQELIFSAGNSQNPNLKSPNDLGSITMPNGFFFGNFRYHNINQQSVEFVNNYFKIIKLAIDIYDKYKINTQIQFPVNTRYGVADTEIYYLFNEIINKILIFKKYFDFTFVDGDFDSYQSSFELEKESKSISWQTDTQSDSDDETNEIVTISDIGSFEFLSYDGNNFLNDEEFENELIKGFNKIGYDYQNKKFNNGGIIKKFTNDNYTITLKYILNGKTLGYLTYYWDGETFSNISPDIKSELYIDMVEVDKEYRGKGIAKKLINKAIDNANKYRADIITLKRDSGLGCSHGSEYDKYLEKIYKSLGFVNTYTKEQASLDDEKNICAMHIDLRNQIKRNEISKYDLGGEVENAERWNKKINGIDDVEFIVQKGGFWQYSHNNAEKICNELANRLLKENGIVMDFKNGGELDKIKLRVRYMDENTVHIWTLADILDEINRDRSEDWTDYDINDWQEGWDEWIEGEYYSLNDIMGKPLNLIPKKMANGGNMEYNYSEKTDEDLIRENLINGEISCIDLTEIIGCKPEYPYQVVGAIKLEKCFLKPYYRLV